MHNEPRQQLCQLIAQYGRSLSEDPRRCGALLKDYCGQYKREIFVLVSALENRVATELLNASAGVPEAIMLSRLTKRLEDELGLTETAAKWAVETWALALGVIDQQIPVSVPTPAHSMPLVSQASSTPVTVSSQPSSTGGRLRFPNFNVGKLKIGGKEYEAIREIVVPVGQTVELSVSNDVTDFSFLQSCDPDGLLVGLSLAGCENFEDRNFAYIKGFENLKALNLSNTGIMGHSGFEEIKSFIDLNSLNFSGCQMLQDRVLNSLENSKKLEFLNLNMGPDKYDENIFISDTGLSSIGKLFNLKILDLNGLAKITGTGVLANIGHMTHLKTLNLNHCRNVSNARLQELKQMLPNTRITP